MISYVYLYVPITQDSFLFPQVNKDDSLDISDDTDYITQIPILLIIVGVFVLLLGVVGTIGAIFAGTIGGRIILGLVSCHVHVYVLFVTQQN